MTGGQKDRGKENRETGDPSAGAAVARLFSLSLFAKRRRRARHDGLKAAEHIGDRRRGASCRHAPRRRGGHCELLSSDR